MSFMSFFLGVVSDVDLTWPQALLVASFCFGLFVCAVRREPSRRPNELHSLTTSTMLN